MNRLITLPRAHGVLHGQLDIPESAGVLVVFAHPRQNPDDSLLAAYLLDMGYALLRLELLTAQEIQFADATQNIPKLAERLLEWLDYLRRDGELTDLPVALLSSGDCTPAAIRAAAQRDLQVKTLICHGGLIDRAGLQALGLLCQPFLLLLDVDDRAGQRSAERAMSHLPAAPCLIQLAAGETPSAHYTAWLKQQLPNHG